MKKSRVMGIVAIVGFSVAGVFLFGLDDQIKTLTPVPEIDVSCEVDADCVDAGGGSCSAGCTWPMNANSRDAAYDWLDTQTSADVECYMDCPPYEDPICEAGECVVYERGYAPE